MAAMTLDGFTEALRAAHGEALVAVALYGSAARGEHVAKHSDHNVLVLVRTLTPAALRATATATRAWTRLGNPPPLVLTEAEWASSRDVFAMEVADILDHHRELHGTLPHGCPESVIGHTARPRLRGREGVRSEAHAESCGSLGGK